MSEIKEIKEEKDINDIKNIEKNENMPKENKIEKKTSNLDFNLLGELLNIAPSGNNEQIDKKQMKKEIKILYILIIKI